MPRVSFSMLKSRFTYNTGTEIWFTTRMLTGPVNCKTTRHAHLSLCANSRKTNDAESRNWPKTSIWAIF